ncbi:MAG: hypothetical protein AAF709_09950 [Pseudomonadota bacterium]
MGMRTEKLNKLIELANERGQVVEIAPDNTIIMHPSSSSHRRASSDGKTIQQVRAEQGRA